MAMRVHLATGVLHSYQNPAYCILFFVLVGSMNRGNVNGRVARQKNKLIPRIVFISVSVLFVAVVSVVTYRIIHHHVHSTDSVVALYDGWNAGDYARVYEVSGNILAKAPLHNAASTFRGYSALFLALSQVEDSSVSQAYLEEAVNRLRIALQTAKASVRPQIEYALGRTYFIKDRTSSYHYYADLAVKYLELSIAHGYKADDIFELLGLSYAELGYTERSIAAFTEALLVRESDILLFDIAKQYYANGQRNVAKQYLYRVISMTNDDLRLMDSRNLLGRIYIDEGNFTDAHKEFEAILEKNENSADAHYGLGVIYENQGDMAKARAEWRKCLRLQVNHAEALSKLS